MTPRKLASLFRLLSACTAFALAATSAQALPVPANVSNGSVSFATNGSELTVTSTPGSIIEWSAFSVGVGETVTFVQAAESSTTLIRVLTDSPLNISGNLTSNGGLFFVSPGGFYGSGTLQAPLLWLLDPNISDADFLAGNYGSPPPSGILILSGGGISNLNVPEPATYAMMLVALVALGAARRRAP